MASILLPVLLHIIKTVCMIEVGDASVLYKKYGCLEAADAVLVTCAYRINTSAQACSHLVPYHRLVIQCLESTQKDLFTHFHCPFSGLQISPHHFRQLSALRVSNTSRG